MVNSQLLRKLLWAVLFLCFLNQTNLKATTFLVANNGTADFNNIQSAINAAANGDVIVVAPATYTGVGNRDIDFKGKAITVRGTDPNNPDNVAATIISCDASNSNQHRAFYFHSSETRASILNGFTITKGYAYGGGVRCEAGSSPTIKNCIFSSNTAPSSSGIGGAIYAAGNAKITNCTFNSNSAYRGGGAIGIEQASPEIENCTFTLNSTSFGWGGAIYIGISGTPIITNCSITNNTATGSRASGGGIYCAANATLESCKLISNNSSVKGGGILCLGGNVSLNRCVLQSNSSPTGGAIHSLGTKLKITDSMIIKNTATTAGGIFGSEYCSLTILNSTFANNSICAIYCDGISALVSNSIIWENASEIIVRNTIYGTGVCATSYSDIKNGYTGIGNINSDPCFVSVANADYHLSSNSPCHNGGDPNYIIFSGETDIDGDSRIQDDIIDIGADESAFSSQILQVVPSACEFTFENGQITPSSNSISIRNVGSGIIDWQITADCPWLQISTISGQCGRDPVQVYFTVDDTKIPSGGIYSTMVTVSSAGAFNSPQQIAVVLKVRSNIIEVPSGAATIQQALDIALPGATIVLSQGTYSGPGNVSLNFRGKGITLRSTDPCNPNIVSSTIIDCMHNSRAVYINVESNPPIVSGLTILNGSATPGGAIYCNMTNAKVSRCVFKNCFSSDDGGAIYADTQSNMIIEFCTFLNNTGGDGGAISSFNNHLIIKNCIFQNNSAGHDGGAIAIESCQPTIVDCLLNDNLAVRGGGVALNYCSSSLVANCTFTENNGNAKGGALFVSGGAGTLKNSILWNDKSYNGPEVYKEDTTFDIVFSDVQGMWQGTGNISSDPCFIDPTNGDYRLNTRSACINSADLIEVGSQFDVAGACRVVNGQQDIGAYENQIVGPIIDLPITIISFHAYVGQNNCISKNLQIENRGIGTLSWNIDKTSCPWLVPTQNAGQLDVNQIISLAVDSHDMQAGVYYGDILVYSNEAINSPENVRVFLHISELGDGLHVPDEYPSIQAAINDSNDGDKVIIAPGIYQGEGNRDVDFSGKRITVKSCDPNDPNIVSATILDCQGTAATQHRGFSFHSSETNNSLVGGLNIINGYVISNGGAINCDPGSPTIFNCRFSNNYTAARGGAIYCYRGNAQIKNCVVSKNLAEQSGGGIYVRNGNQYVFGCVITKNQARSYAGGLYSGTSNAIVRNCVFRDNIGSTITLEGTLIINNCIFWSDDVRSGGIDYATGSAPVITYSDIKGGFAGTGNINIDPNFENVSAENFHLKSGSRCINSGDPTYGPGFGIIDIDGQPRMMDGRTDMGVDEVTGSLTPIIEIMPKTLDYTAFEKYGDPEPQTLMLANSGYGTLNWNVTSDCNWINVIPNQGEAEREKNLLTVRIDISKLSKSFSSGKITVQAIDAWNNPQVIPITIRLIRDIRVPTEYSNIQSAIDSAMDGDTITIEPGTYKGLGNSDLDFKGKQIVVRSLDPNNPDIVASTIIDCAGSQASLHRAFYIHFGEDGNSVITGLTIINGYQTNGGGISIENSSPKVDNCTFVNCIAQHWGGAIYCSSSSAQISKCSFFANSGFEGGAITSYGSSFSSPQLTIERCNIQGNIGSSAGGGINSDSLSSPFIINCIIAGNYAPAGGGISIFQSCPTITNCTITDNSSTSEGSQILQYYAFGTGSKLSNCIIWPSPDQSNPLIALYSGSTMTLSYCDIQFLTDGIVVLPDCTINPLWGNVDVDPEFVSHGRWVSITDPNIEMPPAAPNAKWISGDYHLKSQAWRWNSEHNEWVSDTNTSRCIDAGNPGMSIREEPLAVQLGSNNISVTNLRIDMGAYGGTKEASIASMNWSNIADLNNDGIASGDDFSIVANYWQQIGSELPPDFNHDSKVDLYDISILVQNWLVITDWHTQE